MSAVKQPKIKAPKAPKGKAMKPGKSKPLGKTDYAFGKKKVVA
jgi:hypothetical protein